jgi:RecB family exonuclease
VPPASFSLSYTKLTAYRQCRKKYWFRYISGEPWPPEPINAAGLVGTAVHRGMRVLTQVGIPRLGHAEVEIYLRMPGHEIAGPGTSAWDRAMAYFQAGCEVAAEIPSADRWAERPLVHTFRDGLEITATADRIDRLTSGEWQVIDWKTGIDVDEWTDEQLDLLHVVTRQVPGFPKDAQVTAIAWNLQSRVRSPGYQPRTRRLRREDAVTTVEKFRAFAGQLQQQTDFPAMPGRHCSFCEWRPRCPEALTLEEEP